MDTQDPQQKNCAAPGGGKIDAAATGARFRAAPSGSAHCGGGYGRLGQEHSAIFAEEMAGDWRVPAHFTEWNSSPLVKSATRRGKQRRLLTPTTFSLLHAADFADRCERQIMPLLQGDYLVLADRYIYTAFARDASRGCPPRWLRNLYRFAPIPDITFIFARRWMLRCIAS